MTPVTTTPVTKPPVTVPAEVLDLRNWYLTLPTGADADPDTVVQPDLATYTSPYFQLTDARDGVVFTAPVVGVTTKNSHYPRSELREMNGPDKAGWSNTSGVHTLTLTEAVTQLPDAKPEAVTAQIHDATDDVLQIRLEGSRLLVRYDDGNQQVELDPHYTLGTPYTLTIVAADGHVHLSYNDTTTVDLPLSGTGWYFKAGAYVQSNTSTGDRPPASAQVVISALTVTHSANPAAHPGDSTDRARPSTPPTPTGPASPSDEPSAPASGTEQSRPGVRPVSPNCTVHASGTTVPAVRAGDRCASPMTCPPG
jgi:poly(beta-D-mannuronate) lyase